MQGGKLVDTAGKQASMTIVMPTNFSDWVAAGKEVVNAARRGRHQGQPRHCRSTRSTRAGHRRPGTFDAAIGGFGGTGDPYTDFNNALNSAFAAPISTATANNFERFKDPTVDQALATLAAATDEAPSRQATHQLEQIMYTRCRSC